MGEVVVKVRWEVELKVRWRGQRVRLMSAAVRLSRVGEEVVRVRDIRGCSMGNGCVLRHAAVVVVMEKDGRLECEGRAGRKGA